MIDSALHLDLTFIVNENGTTLRDRFNQLIKDCEYFDCLVGYFYISGFHEVYKSLHNIKRMRILLGIGMTKETYDLIKAEEHNPQSLLVFSHTETKHRSDCRR